MGQVRGEEQSIKCIKLMLNGNLEKYEHIYDNK